MRLISDKRNLFLISLRYMYNVQTKHLPPLALHGRLQYSTAQMQQHQ